MPSTSTSKDTGSKPADIRNFFGNSQASTQPKAGRSRKSTASSVAIDISDDDDPATSILPKMFQKLNGMQLDSDAEMASVKSGPRPSKPAAKASTKPPNNKQEASRKRKSNALLISSEEEEEEPIAPPRKKPALAKPTATSTRPVAVQPQKSTKTKATSRLDSSDEESSAESAAPSKKPVIKKPVASSANAEPKVKKEVKKEAAEEAKPAKPNFAAIAARRAAGPAAPGSKEIPYGEPNCLAGLTFVFTGELESLSRTEAQDLAKRYGGRVTGGPSSKTTHVVLGSDAGPKKLETIKKLNLETLNEDEFLNLIKTREAVLDEKTTEKLRKEEEKIKQDAAEMEKTERKEKKLASRNEKLAADPTSQLWTTKYAPQNMSQICGNKSNVEKIQKWLEDWEKSRKLGFKNPGPGGFNLYRALLIYGPPGIGKTTSAHLCAKMAGYTPIELNASDARSKKLVENVTNVNNSSLDGWMAGGEATNAAGIVITDKTVLIMDEVDGMSAGDRGGVVALKALIKKTQIPIICIANDGQAQKLKPLIGTAANIHFTRPTAAQIKSRIASICYKEKLNIPANVLEQLIQGAQSDIRQVLNMISTWKLSRNDMSFDESKSLAQSNQKYTIMSPFNCTSKVLGPYLFSRTARETLGEKMELYFHEPSLMPLFIQENYLKQAPARASSMPGPDRDLDVLRLMQKASESISDADMVDAMLRGSEQHWSLMPLHACLSLVRPASFMYGTTAHGGTYKDGAAFPQWLGQNSKQSKLQRQLGDVQAKMRMKVSGDKTEIRRYYLPALFPHVIEPFADKDRDKAEVIKEVIDVMDEYYLNKEDWETLVELGVGDRNETTVLKGIPTATKTAFTKAYNSSEHPVAFHRGTDLGAPIKKIAARDAPDVEEAFDLEDEILDDDEDIKPKAKDKGINDKLVKEKKPKAATTTKAAKPKEKVEKKTKAK